jgi:hypothetical protein
MMDWKCFIVAPIGTDLSDLIPIVEDAQWLVLNVEGASPESTDYLAPTSALIAASDAVIALLDSKPNPSLLMEIGYALGAGKPLLTFGDPSKGGISTSSELLSAASVVEATVANTQALRLHVQAFLEGVRNRNSSTDVNARRRTLAKHIAEPRGDLLESSIEREVANNLENAPEVVQYKAQPLARRSRPYTPDFVVWLGGEQRQFGNPVVIEVKSRPLGRRDKEQLLDRLSHYAHVADVTTFIVVVQGTSRPHPRLICSLPLVFEIGLDLFEGLCTGGSLVEALLRERNRFFHSVI